MGCNFPNLVEAVRSTPRTDPLNAASAPNIQSSRRYRGAYRRKMMIRKMQKNRVAGLIAGAAVTVAFCAIGRSDVPKTGSDIQTQQHDVSGNWPAFRGPNRDNISPDTGLLKQWPKGGPPLAWKATGLGDGFASIAIADGRLYTLGAQNQEAAVIAMDANGKKLWSGKLGSGSVDRPGPRSTPTVDGERVYGLDEVGDLGCFDTANGKQVWKINLARDLHGAMMSGWGYSESVLIDGDKLLCTPGGSAGTVAALDKNTGKVIWRSKALTDPAAYASLVPTTIGGTPQYIVFTGKHVAGVGADGAVLWSAARRGQTAVIPTPIVHGNLVFVTSEYNIGCNLFQVTGSGNSFKVEELYHNPDMMVKHGGVVLVG